MDLFFKNAMVYRGGAFVRCDAAVSEGRLSFPADGVPSVSAAVLEGRSICILPGFADVHVHFREPGFSYKETIRTGTMAAARGGYTTVCLMPNLDPVPEDRETLERELEIIRRDAVIRAVPYGAITRGQRGEELADLDAMAPYVCAFSDDGHGVQSGAMMLRAMERAAALGKPIVAHCEENDLLFGGYIHDGEYARAHGHRGICAESEWIPIARDAVLAERAGCAYHVCHVSSAESVDIIRRAKARGVDITCETGPHYLTMNDSMLREDGRFKMNPPIRAERDRLALIEGIKDGTVDMLITDHAPHSAEEKSRGLAGSAMGVVGLETAFPVVYTDLVRTGVLPLETVVSILTEKPRSRFGLDGEGDFCVWDLDAEYTVDPSEFLTMGRATPFEGKRVFGQCLLTVCGGRVAWRDGSLEDLT